jgi:hypothetical protein
MKQNETNIKTVTEEQGITMEVEEMRINSVF